MNNIKNILEMRAKQKFATDRGAQVHKKLQHIIVDGDNSRGDKTIRAQIEKNAQIAGLFDKNSRVEVPIAGIINGRFISRRIDRLRIQNNVIEFIDYKTDTDRDALREKYIAQMREYETLLRAAYPDHKIIGYILWTSDWTLEEIIT